MVHWYVCAWSDFVAVAVHLLDGGIVPVEENIPRNQGDATRDTQDEPKLTSHSYPLVAYTLGIYLLNLFLAFLTPKFDPSLTQDEGLEDGDAGSPSLPTKKDEEFRPFIRRLPEFKFWHSATRAIAIGFVCSWFSVFDIPVFWPVLVMYWIILFVLTSTYPKQPTFKLHCDTNATRGLY